MSSPNPPDEPKVPTGRVLDRSALERVLARASELQTTTGGSPELVSEQQLLEIAKEVGIAPEHVRQAIAEEQTRVAVREPEGRASGIFGPPGAWAQRIVAGTQAEVLARLDRYMQNEECLSVRRRFAERITWEARRDLVGNIKRGFGIGGRRYALSRADEVGATVIAVDPSRVLVRLDASLGAARHRSITGGGAAAGTGIVGAGGLLALAASIPGGSVPVALIVGGAWALLGGAGFAAFARVYRSNVAHAQLALEQALDRLEHGEPSRGTSLFDMLSSAINR